MKLHKTTTLLAQSMLMLGLLGACQNEDLMSPTGQVANMADDKNAKIESEIKLVDDGPNSLQYHKTGRYTGKLSKVSGPTEYTNYAYSDNGIEGDYWITSKRYSKATNALLKEMQYHVVNGRCMQSIDISGNQTFNFTYNETGRLDKIAKQGSSIKFEFSYIYNSAAGAERLYTVTHSNSNGAYKEIKYQYSIWAAQYSVEPKVDKYFLNPVHLDLDKYLFIFGKFSDVLVQQVTITPLPFTNQVKPYYKYIYAFDAAGYATYRTEEHYPLGLGNSSGKQSTFEALKYTSWIPGL